MESVNMIDMARKLNKVKSLEKKVNESFPFLLQTAQFLDSLAKRKASEISYLVKKLEENFDPALLQKLELAQIEINNLVKRLEYENQQGQKFNKMLDELNKLKQNEFITNLSKRLLYGPNDKKK